MFSKKIVLVSILVLAIIVSACSTAPAVTEENVSITEPVVATEEVSGDLVIYSGRSEPLIQPVIDAFRAKYPNVNVLLKAGSNSELANALIEEQANPQADLFITTELFTVQSLSVQGIFQAYTPVGADQLPAEFIGDGNLWTGLTSRV